MATDERWTIWRCPDCDDSYVAGPGEGVEGVRCWHGGAAEADRPLMVPTEVVRADERDRLVALDEDERAVIVDALIGWPAGSIDAAASALKKLCPSERASRGA